MLHLIWENCNFKWIFVDRLPFSIRVLLESAVRNCDSFQIKKSDVENILNWEHSQAIEAGVEVAFKPARVILQVSSFVKRTTSAGSLFCWMSQFYFK